MNIWMDEGLGCNYVDNIFYMRHLNLPSLIAPHSAMVFEQ